MPSKTLSQRVESEEISRATSDNIDDGLMSVSIPHPSLPNQWIPAYVKREDIGGATKATEINNDSDAFAGAKLSDALTTAKSQIADGTIANPRTAAEILAEVTPTNYRYRPGDMLRYSPVDRVAGTTDDFEAIQALVDVAKHGGPKKFSFSHCEQVYFGSEPVRIWGVSDLDFDFSGCPIKNTPSRVYSFLAFPSSLYDMIIGGDYSSAPSNFQNGIFQGDSGLRFLLHFEKDYSKWDTNNITFRNVISRAPEDQHQSLILPYCVDGLNVFDSEFDSETGVFRPFYCRNIKFINNYVKTRNGYGVFMYRPHGVIVTGCRFDGSSEGLNTGTIYNLEVKGGLPEFGTDIWDYQSSTPIDYDINIYDNEFRDSFSAQCNVSASHSDSNDIDGVGESGILYYQWIGIMKNIKIHNNTFRSATGNFGTGTTDGAGIRLRYPSHYSIRGNRLYDGCWIGVIGARNSVIEDNIIHDANPAPSTKAAINFQDYESPNDGGLITEDAKNIHVLNNVIIDSQKLGIRLFGEGHIVTGNKIIRPASYPIRIQDSGPTGLGDSMIITDNQIICDNSDHDAYAGVADSSVDKTNLISPNSYLSPTAQNPYAILSGAGIPANMQVRGQTGGVTARFGKLESGSDTISLFSYNAGMAIGRSDAGGGGANSSIVQFGDKAMYPSADNDLESGRDIRNWSAVNTKAVRSSTGLSLEPEDGEILFNGLPIAGCLIGSTSNDSTAIDAHTTKTIGVSVPGAEEGDPVSLAGPQNMVEGLVATAFVGNPDSVFLRLANITASSINPALYEWKVYVWKVNIPPVEEGS